MTNDFHPAKSNWHLSVHLTQPLNSIWHDCSIFLEIILLDSKTSLFLGFLIFDTTPLSFPGLFFFLTHSFQSFFLLYMHSTLSRWLYPVSELRTQIILTQYSELCPISNCLWDISSIAEINMSKVTLDFYPPNLLTTYQILIRFYLWQQCKR